MNSGDIINFKELHSIMEFEQNILKKIDNTYDIKIQI